MDNVHTLVYGWRRKGGVLVCVRDVRGANRLFGNVNRLLRSVKRVDEGCLKVFCTGDNLFKTLLPIFMHSGVFLKGLFTW